MAEFRVPTPKELQELRKKVGLTQLELAERVGISQSLIARIERGKVNTSVTTLQRILKVIEKERELRLTMRDLLNWKKGTSKLPHLISVTPEDKVRRAVLLMRRNGISQLPVIKGKIPIGSIYESTIIKHMVTLGSKAVFQKSVQEIMEQPFPTVELGDDVDIAFKKIAEGIDAILVLDHDQPVGVVTKIDIIMFMK